MYSKNLTETHLLRKKNREWSSLNNEMRMPTKKKKVTVYFWSLYYTSIFILVPKLKTDSSVIKWIVLNPHQHLTHGCGSSKNTLLQLCPFPAPLRNRTTLKAKGQETPCHSNNIAAIFHKTKSVVLVHIKENNFIFG